MELGTVITIIARKVGVLVDTLKSAFLRVGNAFDRRDVLVFGGLSLLGYGLYLHSPSLAFSVCGSIIMLIGLIGYVAGGSK
jgi:hypothetical protein